MPDRGGVDRLKAGGVFWWGGGLFVGRCEFTFGGDQRWCCVSSVVVVVIGRQRAQPGGLGGRFRSQGGQRRCIGQEEIRTPKLRQR